MNNQELLNKIMSDDFVDELINSGIIETREENGVKYVNPSFEKEIHNIDPISLINKLYDSKNIDIKKMTFDHLFSIHLKSAIKKAIAKINQDFSVENCDFDEYINLVKNSGFDVVSYNIIKKESKEEKSVKIKT